MKERLETGPGMYTSQLALGCGNEGARLRAWSDGHAHARGNAQFREELGGTGSGVVGSGSSSAGLRSGCSRVTRSMISTSYALITRATPRLKAANSSGEISAC